MILFRFFIIYVVFSLITSPMFTLIDLYVKDEHKVLVGYSWGSLTLILSLLFGVANEIWIMLKEKKDESV